MAVQDLCNPGMGAGCNIPGERKKRDCLLETLRSRMFLESEKNLSLAYNITTIYSALYSNKGDSVRTDRGHITEHAVSI